MQVFFNFKILVGLVIDEQVAVKTVGLYAAYVFKLLLLGFLNIIYQCAGGTNALPQLLTAETFERNSSERFEQAVPGRPVFKGFCFKNGGVKFFHGLHVACKIRVIISWWRKNDFTR